jgi:hypothetical protein
MRLAARHFRHEDVEQRPRRARAPRRDQEDHQVHAYSNLSGAPLPYRWEIQGDELAEP